MWEMQIYVYVLQRQQLCKRLQILVRSHTFQNIHMHIYFCFKTHVIVIDDGA